MSGETPGATNLNGTNLSALETEYNISPSDVDGVNETFVNFGAGAGHDLFFTGSLQFDPGECRSMRAFSNTGPSSDGVFEEALLFEASTHSVIFTSILEVDALGFDGATHDFEMLVLENGHGTDTSASTYYFWVEIQ